jgi:hypothetical protein
MLLGEEPGDLPLPVAARAEAVRAGLELRAALLGAQA